VGGGGQRCKKRTKNTGDRGGAGGAVIGKIKKETPEKKGRRPDIRVKDAGAPRKNARWVPKAVQVKRLGLKERRRRPPPMGGSLDGLGRITQALRFLLCEGVSRGKTPR